jgi:hypothetical protein
MKSGKRKDVEKIMTKISLLGALNIPFLVWQWNDSNDIESKKYIREMLQSEDGSKVEIAVSNIIKMFDEGTSDGDYIRNFGNFNFFILGSLVPEMDGAGDRIRLDKLKTDVSLYFGDMFKLGHLDTLPMPDFYYDAKPDVVVERCPERGKCNRLKF